MAKYTGHCTDKFLGRPTTAPPVPGIHPDALDDAKRNWDSIRFGKQSVNFKGHEEGRYSKTRQLADRASGVQHITYNDNPKTHPLIKHENHVLEYRVMYEEKVRTEDGSHIENHECLLRFFVEDSTFEVVEKPAANSGRTEFRLVKRARVPKPDGSGDYTPADIVSGSRVIAYGMSFLVVHGTSLANTYTAAKFGGGMGPATDRPTTAMDGFGATTDSFSRPGTEHMSTHKERVSAHLTQQDFAQQIDNVCLDLLWDDTDALYGDLHELKLKYYLLNDTVDVFLVEAKRYEAKYSGSKTIMKRQKLLKETDLLAPLQGLDSSMRLTSSQGSRAAPKQTFQDAAAPGNFYHWSELLPGTEISLLGRKARVVGFGNLRTERFFAKQMGAGLVEELKSKFRVETTRPTPVYEHAIPEHTGIGSYEDTLRSVKAIAPKAPPGLAGNDVALRFKLQFKAVLLSNIQADKTREFILSFFCEDGTLTIYESSPRNSGRPSYTFAARSKYIKAYDYTSNGNAPIYYNLKDVFVGATLVVNGHHFELTDAAPGTETFMEAHADHFN